MSLSYGSVCSGIEAASLAWEPLGFKPLWLSEIEPFPCAVLRHRWPTVPNLGDMTLLADQVREGIVPTPDVLVGGTPCQDFSIAGLRAGRKGERGALTFSYLDLANAIDNKRHDNGQHPIIIVWENVPGVLSDARNAFGQFLAGLAGEDTEFEPGPRPERGKSNQYWRWCKKTVRHVATWPQRGCVYGPQRKLAWRVLDAQYYGLAQRRKRVFVVASARTDLDPAAILFEFDGLRRDSTPGRETSSTVAALTASGVGTCGADDNQGQAGHLIPTAFGGGRTSGPVDVAACLTAKGQRIDFEVETFAVHSTQDPDVKVDLAHTLGCNHGQENACIAFSYKDHGQDVSNNISPTLRAGNSDTANANSADAVACIHSVSLRGREGGGTAELGGDVATCLRASAGGGDKPHVLNNMSVRRLTPRECERLQGFPDDYTLVPFGRVVRPEKMDRDFAKYLMRGGHMTFEDCCRAAADGHRYKAIGNSMAVPVMSWIGSRVQQAVNAQTMTEPVYHIRTPKTDEELSRPFLKWAGGKYSVFRTIESFFPASGRLIEPFAGAGSVFLNAGFASNVIADANGDLINTYQMLKLHAHDLITLTHRFFSDYGNEEAYNNVKEKFNRMHYTSIERAAAFIYLNKHCFNGLVRYNKKGEFNVSWGKPTKAHFPLREMENFLSVAQRCEFKHAHYPETIRLAGPGDVVFCDPPYEPLPDKIGFTKYGPDSFRFDDQELLVKCLHAAHQRGARVIITNSGAPNIEELYRRTGFTLHALNNRRNISCKGETRERVNDVIAVL
ncbi:Dam family site-specific DNA-(adenine-N6)-methyltransferase [Escherichia coli]|uniref:Dam family site-specific DNA-(adenine-N6)-methyltransferase n=1 Tax=Escherichia coli TaxID=562 RepID=UPI001791E343|nr:Dam family site-specific DNA-(adenine-N6)-methyltransferase [Escherichia coli]EKI3096596.1 Dam family site-specific DNA-(adenine-N6)-methyltransferase [Escherichia coli]MBB9841095.1 Dam family site-specific DNA-(adenine-N6)-methyltransferase [Escherichia coli]MBS9328521.1 Dam family site-specific DNA-(adenine-N6)-methyltransferase [Escherichia coli]